MDYFCVFICQVADPNCPIEIDDPIIEISYENVMTVLSQNIDFICFSRHFLNEILLEMRFLLKSGFDVFQHQNLPSKPSIADLGSCAGSVLNFTLGKLGHIFSL